MIDKRQEGDTQHPIKDAGTAHLAQAQNDLSSASTRTALMDQARAGYTRGGVSDTLDFNNFGNLYGNGAGPLDSTASTTSTATSRDLTTAFNQALSDRGVLPFAAGSDLATPLSGGGAAAVRADSTVATATPDATVGAPAVAGDARPTTTTTAPPPSDAGGVEVKRGDSLWKIARHQLGPHASNSDVMKYVKDMAKENGMPDPFKPENHRATIIHPGQHLKLPAGHSDAPQTTPQTQPHDTPPQTQPITPHARPEIQQPGQPQPQPEPQPQKQPDVQPETKPPAKPTDLPANPSDNPTPRPEAAPPSSDGQGLDATRTKLQQDVASSSLPDAEKQRMLDNMKAFEARAAAEHLSPDEIQKTYQQADRLLSSTGDSPIPATDKAVLADQIINHAAHPTDIDQGGHNTCGPTSLEARTFMRHPSQAAQLIADVGTTGQYTGKDGTTVKLTQNDLAKDREAESNPPGDNQRSYASKLFQETALNLHYQPLGKRYVEIPAQPGDKRGVDREYIVDGNGNRHDSHGVTLPELSDMESKITGKVDGNHFIGSEQAQGRGADSYHTFSSAQDMAAQLTADKANGELPVTVWVDSSKEPFRTDGGFAAGGQGGGHFVTITDYDPATGTVKVDNQWGRNADHLNNNGIPIQQMYDATTTTPPIKTFIPQVQQDLNQNEERHRLQRGLTY